MNPRHAHQSPVCDLGTRQVLWMAHVLQISCGSLRFQSPEETAAGLGTGRRRSGRREAVENDPSLQRRRENLAHSSPDREKENRFTIIESIFSWKVHLQKWGWSLIYSKDNYMFTTKSLALFRVERIAVPIAPTERTELCVFYSLTAARLTSVVMRL